MEVNRAAVGRTSRAIEGAVMRSASEETLKEGPFEQLHIPGHAPIKLIGLSEGDVSAKVRPRRQQKVQNAILVTARETATQNFEVQRNASFIRSYSKGLLNRVIEKSGA